MDPVASVMDKLKGFAKSSREFVKGVLYRRHVSACCNPIEILKRLQREAFSDIMKLRDRQDKVERMLSFYRSSKGSPFQESSSHVKGEVDVVGALLFVDKVDQQSSDTLNRSGIRTGIDSRFIFETTIRQTDSILAEFMASQNDQGCVDNDFGSPLSLTKVMYLANFSDWFSAVAIPVGARCKDVAIASNPSQQERGLTDFSSLRPPILGQCHGAAVGLMVKRLNIAASVAEFISVVGMQPDSVGTRHCFSTFGQVICQLSKGTKLAILGLHKKLNKPSQPIRLHKLTLPIGSLKCHKIHDAPAETSTSSTTSNAEDNILADSIALMLESELDESTRIGGWIEMQNSSPRHLRWAVTISDTPEDELGWGLSLVGMMRGPSTWDHCQVEAFLKFNMGKRFSLQPGFVYVMDGTVHIPALMFRSSWSL